MEPWVWNHEKANCFTSEVEFNKYWKGFHADPRNSSGVTGSKEKLSCGDYSHLEQVFCGGSAASVLGGFPDQFR